MNTSKNNNRVKVIRECSVKHFIFYYNSTCKVYKDTKYGAGWWSQKPKSNYTKAIRELDDK